MNNKEIRAQCDWFIRDLRWPVVSEDFVRRLNDFVAEYPTFWENDNEYGEAFLKALLKNLANAIRRGHYRFSELQASVIRATPRVLAETDEKGWTPLHYVCHYDPRGLDVISFFAEQFPDAVNAKDRKQATPLHLACCMIAPLPVIRALVRTNPKATLSRDQFLDTPLHDLCRRGGSLDAIQFLAKQEPLSCLYRNRDDHLPMDKAKKRFMDKKHRYDPNVFEFMLTATKAAANVLLERLRFGGLLPREIFAMVSTYFDAYNHVPLQVSAVTLALATNEAVVLFRRGDMREEFCEQL